MSCEYWYLQNVFLFLYHCCILSEIKLTTTMCLTHWGRVTHICVSDLTSIGSDNGLSPGRRQAIIRTNAGILLIRPLGTHFSEFLVKILIFSFKKMRLKVSSAIRRPFCLGLNELKQCYVMLDHWHNWGSADSGRLPFGSPTSMTRKQGSWDVGTNDSVRPRVDQAEKEKHTLGTQIADEINLSGINMIFIDQKPVARRW